MPLVIKLVRGVTYHDKVPPIKNMTFQSRGLLRSRDKLKPFYLYYQSIKLGRMVICLRGKRDYVVLRYHVAV